MKNILFINGGKKKFGSDFLDECVAQNITCTPVRFRNMLFILDNDIKVLHLGKEMDFTPIDYAFIRVRGKYSHTSALFTRVLEHCDIPYNDITNREHTDSMEKTMQAVLFSINSVPIPKTIILNNDTIEEQRAVIDRELSYPLVLKVDGSQGKNVWKVQTYEELLSITDGWRPGKLIILQEFLDNTYDIRALFFNNEYIGAIKRSSTDGFYNNVSKGGKVERIELSNNDIQIAQRAIKAVNADFCGVDLMHAQDRTVVIEVNIGPQVYGFEGAHGISVARYLVKKISEMK